MSKNLRSTFMVVALLFILTATELVNASPAVKIAIEPSEVTDLESGATFTVNVTISDVVNLYGWQVNITFNPGILNVEETAEGPLLKQVNETIYVKKIDNDRGYVLASCSWMPPYPAQGVNGSGILMSITFTVKGSGVSSLSFVKAATKLNTVIASNRVPITDFTTDNGSFRNAAPGLGIPLELVAGVIGVVGVGGVLAFFFMRRRRKST